MQVCMWIKRAFTGQLTSKMETTLEPGSTELGHFSKSYHERILSISTTETENFFFQIYLSERMREREREEGRKRDRFSSPCFLLNAHTAGARPGARNSIWASHKGSRKPVSTWAIFCCVPVAFSGSWVRKRGRI